ncbi:hypothetical protein DEDE109153_08150 [Deinococcus deserti]|uniref:Uncharacterized protein n=1 Tax=Deinococcus deserti (strain DSM 17065 / CIP 109153 / LMG 22923 / VCD115) TaxID=546414 RepID=C1D3P1_DEIDV|nr:hypothetical protein [Deinococcus deserti]ACO48120.1 hypothetical protein Deide_3p01740 [Deinococcus deserti VCD115]
MRFELVPTLNELRSVYARPLDARRFQAYLDTVINGAQSAKAVRLPPLVLANPMAKAHVLNVLDQWLTLDAEETARAALEEANARLLHVAYDAAVKVGLTLLDDVAGGWTNRNINDAMRFHTAQALKTSGWVTVCLWTSAVPQRAALRQTVLECAQRAALAACHGDPCTLLGMMRQEGAAAVFAERTLEFNAEELAYSRAVLAPLLESSHQPTVLAAMYGDEAARDWGYTPLGLSNQAGFQVALADALESQARPPA